MKAIRNELFILAESGSFQDLVASVGLVSEKRMSDGLHVDAYLVSSSCFKAALYLAYVTEPLQNGIVGYGRLTVFPIWKDSHYFSIFQTSAYVTLYRTLVIADISPHEGGIFSFYAVLKKLFGKKGLCIFVFGDQKQACGVLIDTMDKQRFGSFPLFVLLISEMKGKSIQKSTRVVAIARVNHHR